MEIKVAKDKESWDNFLIQNDGSFLQSWNFGIFQEKEGKKIWRFEFLRKEQKIAQVQIQKEYFPFGKNLFYIGYGPCFDSRIFLKEKKKILILLEKKLKKIARKENVIFLNIEPKDNLPKIKEAKESKRRVQPQKTLILPLKNKKESIFENFHPKTRYNIRLAEKKGVEVQAILGTKEKMNFLENFFSLILKTSKRGKFKIFPKKHYKNLLSIENAILYLARYKEKIIAANIVFYFGEKAYYLHGASDYKYRHLMAPHLLQWKQICDAKENGKELYDFWGIDEIKWPGITRFKKSFGGEEIIYPKGIDLVFNNFYYSLYCLLKKIF